MLILMLETGNFATECKKRHSGSHVYAWAAISIYLYSGFPRTSNFDMALQFHAFRIIYLKRGSEGLRFPHGLFYEKT